jgi:hypothetical protein
MGAGAVTFQSQNPARSGDKSSYVDARGRTRLAGWTNCTAFVAAMGAEFDAGVRLTGTEVRAESNEPVPDAASPGLNLRQVKKVLRTHGVKLDVATPIDFDDLDEVRRAGHAVALQLSYRPIRKTEFSGDPTFEGGHVVLWLPNGDVFDPLDDGRRKGIARAPVRIPTELLRRAAGKLVLNRKGRIVGVGSAYAGIFPTVHAAGGGAPSGVVLAFGATADQTGEYRVVVATALVRSSPAGVPDQANVVDRKPRGLRVKVVGTTQGQRVGGSRVWHQVNRAGTRFMHSSVIKPVN